MSERWREVRRCACRQDAELLRVRLAQSGVTARVPDSRVMGVQPTCANRAPGVSLLVPEQQVDLAVRLLGAAASAP